MRSSSVSHLVKNSWWRGGRVGQGVPEVIVRRRLCGDLAWVSWRLGRAPAHRASAHEGETEVGTGGR